MSLKDQRDIVIAMQFLFDPQDPRKLLKENNNVCAYKITANGRLFIGNRAFKNPIWERPLELLCENTLSSVTFYTETYTKAMMPDRIAGNLSDLMIAYSRVYKSFNPNDSLTVSLGNNLTWSKRISYNTDLATIRVSGTTLVDNEPYLIYPFVMDNIPDFFRMKKPDSSILKVKPGYSIKEFYSRTCKGNVYCIDFPNIKLKPNLDNDISPTNKDPFNILL